MTNINFEKLENNIIDVIKEEQAKLGYRKENIRLYYPISSLCHILEVQAQPEEMDGILISFGKYTRKRLGQVEVSRKGERFCFLIPEQGAEYVHENTEADEFINELIALVGSHDCTLDQVKDLFKTKGENIDIQPIDSDEFDLLIRFRDSADKYYYCFKDEGGHVIYHRFLPEDYAELGF